MRRGRETANALFGNSASVLVGDFIYTRSFQMMVKLNNNTSLGETKKEKTKSIKADQTQGRPIATLINHQADQSPG